MARARDVGADFFPGVLQVAFDKNWTTPQELYHDAQKCAFKAEVDEQFNATELNMGCAVSDPWAPCPFFELALSGIVAHTHL
jgi:hypothetical protein